MLTALEKLLREIPQMHLISLEQSGKETPLAGLVNACVNTDVVSAKGALAALGDMRKLMDELEKKLETGA